MILQACSLVLSVSFVCPQTFDRSTIETNRPLNQTGKPTPQLAEARFITVQPGTFLMGSNAGEKNESPVHRVTIDREFELQETEVTQAQWEALMGNNPSHYRGPDRPVESVSWHDIQKFLSRLNASQDVYRYRLPTEAEWEYACRTGTKEEVAGDLEERGLYEKNSELTTHPVRSKRPNAWGLYDMHGNVWEWVQDWLGKYPAKQLINPQGRGRGKLRVLRGGGWHSGGDACRCAFRLGSEPSFRNSALGFRLVRTR